LLGLYSVSIEGEAASFAEYTIEVMTPLWDDDD
jgi:hypothetical protein